MDDERQEKTPTTAIPDDALVVRQSNWAWIWAIVPWLVFLGVSPLIDFLTFGIVPAVLAIIVVGGRYLSFRKTAYILTDNNVIIHQGSFMGQQSVSLPYEDLEDPVVQPSTLRTSLGYARVTLPLNDGRSVLLHYVPIASPLVEELRARISR
jgi:uncharacterized membrane protein YdbT with pleckstrin-like domain